MSFFSSAPVQRSNSSENVNDLESAQRYINICEKMLRDQEQRFLDQKQKYDETVKTYERKLREQNEDLMKGTLIATELIQRVEEKDAELQEFRNTVEEKDDELQELRNTIAEKATMEVHIQKRIAELEVIKLQNNTTTADLYRAHGEGDFKSRMAADEKNLRVEYEGYRTTSIREMEEKTNEVEALHLEVSKYANEVEALKVEVADKDVKIRRRDAKIKQLLERLFGASGRRAERRNVISPLNMTLHHVNLFDNIGRENNEYQIFDYQKLFDGEEFGEEAVVAIRHNVHNEMARFFITQVKELLTRRLIAKNLCEGLSRQVEERYGGRWNVLFSLVNIPTLLRPVESDRYIKFRIAKNIFVAFDMNRGRQHLSVHKSARGDRFQETETYVCQRYEMSDAMLNVLIPRFVTLAEDLNCREFVEWAAERYGGRWVVRLYELDPRGFVAVESGDRNLVVRIGMKLFSCVQKL